MATYLMDKTYRITTSGGIPAGRVVVASNNTGQCQLPETANAPRILGITMTSQPELGRGITVRKAGIARVVAAGSIAVGDPVCVADSNGRVSSIQNVPPGSKPNVLGFAETAAGAAGDLIEVFISMYTAPAES